MKTFRLGEWVYTPQGKGQVAYIMPGGEALVQFEHGSGCIYRPGQCFSACVEIKVCPKHRSMIGVLSSVA